MSDLTPPTANDRDPPARAVRHLGHFQLLRLMAKTARTMAWLVIDPRVGAQGVERVLVMPRERMADAQALDTWMGQARQAARVAHPALLQPVDVGQQEQYAYLAYERDSLRLWTEVLDARGQLAADLVPAFSHLLEGLAFAHDSGLVHRDVHAGMVAVGSDGRLRWLGFGVVPAPPGEGQGMAARRLAAQRDVLGAGLVLHQALAGRPALDEPDAMAVADRMTPRGQELVRLPFADVQPIAEPLRAIVNRATDRQERQRYRSARTFARALQGWMRASADDQAGALALVKDRMRQIGLLPLGPGGTQRAMRLELMHGARTEQLAEQVLDDAGLSFELIRAVNVAMRRVGAGADNGPILTVRRGIDMLGLDGVVRAARALRPWPGPLNDAQAADLAHQLELARLAGQVARWLRPAGYDGELVYLLGLMQRLGRLVVQYHFPDDAVQIRRLMQPMPAARQGEADEPGMSEQSAAYAVLGVDLDALTLAVGRHWGFDDASLQLMRRQPLEAAVHPPTRDVDVLRLSASLGNEVVDLRAVPAERRSAAVDRLAHRYARALGVTAQDLARCVAGQPPEGLEDEAAPQNGTENEGVEVGRVGEGGQAAPGGHADQGRPTHAAAQVDTRAPVDTRAAMAPSPETGSDLDIRPGESRLSARARAARRPAAVGTGAGAGSSTSP